MVAALDALEMNDDAKVVVITGAGDAFSAGQDLKEYFREPDAGDPRLRERLHAANSYWQWRRLMYYPKPTIAMVNGWCFGGAFQVLLGCDLAVQRRTRSSGSARSTGASSPPESSRSRWRWPWHSVRPCTTS